MKRISIPHGLEDICVLKKVSEVSKDPVFCGGPCICFSKGNPYRLTVQDLVDCVIPAKFAVENEARCLIYFQSYESVMMKDVIFPDRNLVDYKLMKTLLEMGLRVLLGDDIISRIIWVDTSEPYVKDLIDKYESLIKVAMPRGELYGLYSVKEGSYPMGTPEENTMIEIYYRNLTLHSAEFLKHFIGGSEAFFTENSSQAKAVKKVVDSFHQKAGYFLYQASMNRKNVEMNLGNRNHKIDLRCSKDQLLNRGSFEDDRIKSYYRSIFAEDVVQVMEKWIERVEKLC